MSEQTVAQALRASGLPVLDARVLLAHVLKVEPVWLLTHDDAVLDEHTQQCFAALADRRRQGEPVAYLVGEKEFWGLRFEVTPDVLIPRADTETLVEAALRFISLDQTARVLDLGTGSGAVAIALAHERRRAEVWACDISSAALQVAQRNAACLLGADAARMRWCLTDWFTALLRPDREEEKFDVIVSNPPYIVEGDVHLAGDVRYEPHGALVSGVSGLNALRTIVREAPTFLRNGGVLLLEHGYDQSAAVLELLVAAGFSECEVAYDLAGIARVAIGRWKYLRG